MFVRLQVSLPIVVLLLLLPAAPTLAQCAFFDDFQRPDSTTVGFGWVEVESLAPEILITSFDVFSFVDVVGTGVAPASLTQSNIDTSSLTDPALTFVWQARNGNAEATDVLQVDWRLSGGVWEQLGEFDLTNTITTVEELPLPPAAINTVIDIRFVIIVDEFQEGILLDDVGVCEVAGPPDCNSNGVDDADDLTGGTSLDQNANSIPDECDECVFDIDCSNGLFCDGTEICFVDFCQFQSPPCSAGQLCDEGTDDCFADGPDCNSNGVGDSTDIAGGTSFDNNANSIPDECDECVFDADCDDGLFCTGGETCNVDTCVTGMNPCSIGEDCDEVGDVCFVMIDCNSNSISDPFDISGGTSTDQNFNTVPDECDECVLDDVCDNGLFCDGSEVCVVDQCTNGLPPCGAGQLCDDAADVCLPDGVDCNSNAVADATDINGATSDDLNSNGAPDECDECVNDFDCDDGEFCNGMEACIVDVCTINLLPCDVGQLCDEETDLCVPDGADCNTNGIGDDFDIILSTSVDQNSNGVPDECDECVFDSDCDDEFFCSGSETCDVDSCLPGANPCLTGQACDEIGDACQPIGLDCNTNGIGDTTDIFGGTSLDCDSNGIPDDCDIVSGVATDCNQNAIPDLCDLASEAFDDCNTNGVLDVCDLAIGSAADCDTNGVPDACQVDGDIDGVIDACDQCPGTPSGLIMGSNGCPLELGPCCFFGEICIDDRIESECTILDGTYMGDGLTCDLDPDGDGATGCEDLCPLDGGKVEPGICGCGVPDSDLDMDGLVDCEDLCPDSPLGDPINECGCTALGACEFTQGFCWDELDEATCGLISGLYMGDGSACDDAFTFGDIDVDGDVDLSDFAYFQECFNLSDSINMGWQCVPGDFDGCGSVNIVDYEAFIRFMVGPNG